MSLDRAELGQSCHLERDLEVTHGDSDTQAAGFTSLCSTVGRRGLPWRELSAAQPRASEGGQQLQGGQSTYASP